MQGLNNLMDWLLREKKVCALASAKPGVKIIDHLQHFINMLWIASSVCLLGVVCGSDKPGLHAGLQNQFQLCAALCRLRSLPWRCL